MKSLIIAASIVASGLSAVSAEEVPVRGVIRSSNEAVLSTDIVARVSAMPLKEGDSFVAGDLLIRFDCAVQEAEIAAARAAYSAAREVFVSSEELASFNAIGKSDLRTARSRMEQADAEAKAAEARSRDCEIRAPFSGRVVETMIHAHETSGRGEPLMKILDDTDLEIELLVPSNWLVWLKAGTAFSFLVDETGNTYSASISRLGGAVDPVSQTIRIFGALNARPEEILSGMSGNAVFSVPNG